MPWMAFSRPPPKPFILTWLFKKPRSNSKEPKSSPDNKAAWGTDLLPLFDLSTRPAVFVATTAPKWLVAVRIVLLRVELICIQHDVGVSIRLVFTEILLISLYCCVF